MSRRFLFLCPDVSGSSGGVAVLYDAVTELRGAGYDASIVHMSPTARYHNTPHEVPVSYTHATRLAGLRHATPPRKVLSHAAIALERLKSGPNPRLALAPGDVLVVPEFLVALAAEAFPANPKIVFVQNSFGYLRSCATALERGFDPQNGVRLSIGISDTCLQALDLVGASPTAYCPVSPNFALFPYRAEKKRQVAYMPRKRKAEARIIHDALEARGHMAGHALVRVDGMPQARVAEVLGESLFFISLMREEALGFPAMEAMASGCVVVGYTGLGTREYFTPETGIPVEEGDTPGVVHSVEKAIAEYDRDPSRLDAMRMEAARLVTAKYSREAFHEGLLRAWATLPN